ncbi:hypothetical protein [uncultured Actinomyces sp.]|jgi:hypothetical protein avisC_04906|uniref:hypothetical protein n=1 Tax=uncultured Actinomyces sp. TaxID=249061 RepID=UPI0025E16FBE|nr:hypothetical protein [uncultured Actinomyces sp.]
MRQQIRFLAHVLGRRETIKYLSIAAVGAAIAPLTGCSGSTLAFKKFAAGTWDVTMDGLEKAPDITVTVEDGKWKFVPKNGDQDRQTEGTWTLSGTSLTLKETGDAEWFFKKDSEGVGMGVPEEVNTDEIPKSFKWRYENDEELDVPLSWDKKTQTLTLTGTDSNEKPFTINAKKQEK